MNKGYYEIKPFVQNVAKLYPFDIEESFAYINKYYEYHKEIKDILQDNKAYFQSQYLTQDYLSYEQFMNNHPILGHYTRHHAFNYPPLYKYINPLERQLTTALSAFLSQNQQTCKAFVEAVLETMGYHDVICSSKDIDCRCEECTKKGNEKKNKRKRIDNIFSWENAILAIEVKFDAPIKNNNLKVYKRYVKSIAKGRKTFFAVISIQDLQAEISKKSKEWCNIYWSKVLRLWEEKLKQTQEDEDLKRYRSSLWNKIL